MNELDELVKEFLVESNENLDRLDRDFVSLEQNPDDRDRLASIFRTIHTIKGTSGFFGFGKLGTVAHVGENLLSQLRDGVMQLNPELTSALLKMVDAVREMLSRIEETGQEGDGDYQALIDLLTRLNTGAAADPHAPPSPLPSPPTVEAPPPSAIAPSALVEKSTPAPKPLDAPVEPASPQEPACRQAPAKSGSSSPASASAETRGSRRLKIGELLVRLGRIPPEQLTNAVRDHQQMRERRLGAFLVEKGFVSQDQVDSALKQQQNSSTNERLGDLLVRLGWLSTERLEEALRCQQEQRKTKLGEFLVERGLVTLQHLSHALKTQEEENAKGASLSDNTIRVDVGLLDQLMSLVGELVLARNNLLQHTTSGSNAALQHASQRLNLITTDLQERVMKTRMQAIGNVFNKFPRVVRDLAVTCGKHVRLEMAGQETELDKTLIEAIKDPLTHLVRNAVDHGVETPEMRVEKGKPAEGNLLLRAFHEGGQVIIELCDDGGGIDPDRVKRKALERGLIGRDQAERMTDRDAVSLIFLPGFSTAEKVTSVSGRGVGMDVVKTNIEKIGGSVEIQSHLGHGTSLKIKIPLTLAIIPALIVSVGGDRYAIPQAGLLELVRLKGEQARKGIENIHGTPVYRLRGTLLPLVYLHKLMKISPDQPARKGRGGKAFAVHGLDLPAVRDMHLKWKTTIRKYLESDQEKATPDILSHKECALGQWLYSKGLNHLGYLPHMDELEKTHKSLHSVLRLLIKQVRAGDRLSAQALLPQLDTLTDETCRLIEGLESLQNNTVMNIVVLQANGRPFGLVVDRINDTEEIVVKPLSKHLKSLPIYAGATIMGDGRVALILDVLSIAHQAGLRGNDRPGSTVAGNVNVLARAKNVQPVLLIQAGEHSRLALPLSRVTRLETFPRSMIEYVGSREVVKYRDEIMPLFRLSVVLPGIGSSERETRILRVIVHTEEGKSVGLIVERILDIVEEGLLVQARHRRPGVLGTAVIQGQVTEVVDVSAVVSNVDPTFYERLERLSSLEGLGGL